MLFSLRSHVGRNRAVSAFTVLAIAASVALATGLEMSTRSVHAELDRTADALAGAAKLEVSGGNLGVSEELLERVAAVPGVLQASPLIQKTFQLDEGPLAGQALRVLGVDFLADHRVRGYRILRGELQIRDPLRALAQLEAVIVTQKLAERLGIGEGDSLRVRSGADRFTLTVRGLLLSGGVADAYDGQIATMDIYALQELLGRRGWIDRIDIVPDPEFELEQVRATLAQEVHGFATVRRSASRGEFADRAFGTINLGVWTLAIMGVLVAAFLTYGTVSLSVDRRSEEFALLQSAGLESRKVRRLVRVDGILLSAVGTVLGFGAGLWLSRSFFALFSDLSDHLQKIEIKHLEVSIWTVLLALVVGVAVSFAAGLEPAHRATAMPPLEVLRAARRAYHPSPMSRRRIAFIIAVVATLLATWTLPMALPSLVKVALIYASFILLLVIAFPPIALPLLRLSSPLFERLIPRVGSFVGLSLLARPMHTGLTTTAIAGIVGGLIGIVIVLTSVTDSFDSWIGERYRGGVLISVSDPFASAFATADLVPQKMVEGIREAAGAGDLLESYVSTILLDGDEVVVIARSYDVMARHGDISAVVGRSGPISRAISKGQVAVSEAFSRRFGFRVGDSLPIPTPRGQVSFPIAGIVRDYASSAGTIHIDIKNFDQYWTRSGAGVVVIWPDGPVEQITGRIRQRFGADGPLFFTPSAEYGKAADRILSRFSALLFLVVGLISLLGGLAVLNMMFGALSERRRELALLRMSGATRGHLISIVFSDSLLIGILGAGAGIVLGIGCSIPMLGILSESLGWTVEHRLHWPLIAAIALGAITAAGSAGFFPAWTAQRIRPVEMFTPD